MSPTGVSSIFLLVVLMDMLDTSTAHGHAGASASHDRFQMTRLQRVKAGVAQICAAKYPVQACNIEDHSWFVLDDKRCMKVTWGHLTFDEAQEQCKSKGAELVSVHNKEQFVSLLCYMFWLTNGERMTFWIGAKRGDKGFYWVDGSGAMMFSRWARGRTDSFGFRETCVEMNGEWGRWRDKDCEFKLPSVCAKKK